MQIYIQFEQQYGTTVGSVFSCPSYCVNDSQL